MIKWTDLPDDAKRAHNSQVQQAAVAIPAAEAKLAEARLHLKPAYPATWRADSALVAAQQAEAEYLRAVEAHRAIVSQYPQP